MRSRVGLGLLALAGLAVGVPAAMTGTTARGTSGVGIGANRPGPISVLGLPWGLVAWLLVGLIGIAVGVVGLRRCRPVAAVHEPVTASPTSPTVRSDANVAAA